MSKEEPMNVACDLCKCWLPRVLTDKFYGKYYCRSTFLQSKCENLEASRVLSEVKALKSPSPPLTFETSRIKEVEIESISTLHSIQIKEGLNIL